MEIILLERIEKLGTHRRRRHRQGRLRPQLPAAEQEGAARQRGQPQGLRSQPRARSRPTTPSAAARPRSTPSERRGQAGRPDPRFVELGPALRLGLGARHRRRAERRRRQRRQVDDRARTPDQDASACSTCASRCTPKSSVTVKVNVARSPDEAELQAPGRRRAWPRCSTADVAGFTEAFDPNAEPGEIPADLLEEQPAEGEAEA